MNEVQNILIGVAATIGLAVIVFVVALLVIIASRLNKIINAADKALVPFGQSGVGRLVNQAAIQGRAYVDQASDPLVRQFTDLLNSVAFIMQVSKAAGVEITYDKVAVWGRAIFDALEGLTDGIPAQETISKSLRVDETIK